MHSHDSNESTTISAFVYIAAHFGIEVGRSELFRKLPLEAQEATFRELSTLSAEYGLRCKAITLRAEQLPSLNKSLPAMLRIAGDKVVILDDMKITDEKQIVYFIRDPITDRVAEADIIQLSTVWKGAAIIFKRVVESTEDTQPFGKDWVIRQILRERQIFMQIAAAALLGTVFALAPPFTFMIVANRVLVNNSFATLNVIATLIVLLIVFEALVGHARRHAIEIATARIDSRLNLYMFNKVLKLPIDYFEKNPTGQTLSKLNRLHVIRTFLTGQLFGALIDTVPLLGIVPALFILDWRLAIQVVALAIILFIVILFFVKPLDFRFAKVIKAEQKRGSHLVETIHGIRTIKSLAIESVRKKQWDGIIAENTKAKYDMGSLSNWPQTLSVPIERFIYSGSFVVGAYIALNSPDSTTAGVLGAFAMLSMRLATPIVQLARLQLTTAELTGAVGELSELLNTKPEDGNESKGVRSNIQGRLEFKSVCFRYSQSLPNVLDQLSFDIPSGFSVGIVGRSGSGKTTITRLLQGLHKNYEGIIKIDGVELRDYSLSHLRSSIGVVLQENFLFSGTVRENISIAQPNAAFEEVVKVCQLAGAEEFVEKLPRGYDTRLEEGASNLSGGQRQRLAIARALLSNPKMLILDEATSALDAESESIVNENLRAISSGRTVICVSHRLSMLTQFDRIIVMDKGRIYDMGKHLELLERCDIYAHLWHQQNKHST